MVTSGVAEPVATTTRLRVLLTKGVFGIVVDPVREGRLRARGWDLGLRVIVGCSLVLYAALLASALAAGWLRTHTDLVDTNGLSTPRVASLLVLVAIVWCVALLVTGALHAPWWARLVMLLVAVPLPLNFGFGSIWSTNRLAGYGSALAIVLLTVAVWRRRPAGWEFPVVLIAVGVGVLVPLQLNSNTSRNLGFEVVDSLMALQVQRLAQLAVPAAALAGIAGVQLAISTADRAVTAATRLPRLVLPVVLVLGLGRIAMLVPTLADRSTDTGVARWAELLGAAALLALGMLVLWGLLVLSRAAVRPTPDQASEEMGRLGLPIAVGLMWVVLPLLLLPSLSVLLASYGIRNGFTQWLGDRTTDVGRVGVQLGGRLVVVAVLVALAVVWARRGRLLPAILAGESALVVVLVFSDRLTGGLLKVPVSPAAVVEVASAAAVIGVVVLRLRGRLSDRSLGALGSFVVLGWAFALGDLLGSPITTILGVSGVSLLLYGLVWSFLTGAAGANEDSPRFPRHSRVLLFLANAVFAIAVVAYSLLVRSGTTPVLTITDPSQFGLQVLGTALLLSAAALLLRRVMADEPLPPTEVQPDVPTGIRARPRSLDQ